MPPLQCAPNVALTLRQLEIVAQWYHTPGEEIMERWSVTRGDEIVWISPSPQDPGTFGTSWAELIIPRPCRVRMLMDRVTPVSTTKVEMGSADSEYIVWRCGLVLGDGGASVTVPVH